MDVRCEKCLTVYELDDVRVGDAGLTVKCQECGNLFKVRRRSNTREIVVAEPTGETQLPPQDATTRDTAPGVPRPTGETRPVEPPGWLLRSPRTGEVKRFRELTTLQQWIVERKVGREDEISRGGESWKALGGIAELASFFHVVEQAESVARASHPGLAVRTANEVGGLDPTEMGRLQTTIRAPLSPNGSLFTDIDTETTTTEEAAQGHGLRNALVALLVLGGAGAGGWAWWQHTKAGEAQEASRAAMVELDRGRAALALDTDEGYRQAIAILEPIIEKGDDQVARDVSVAARVALAEAHTWWATDLGESALQVEQAGAGGASAAHTMRADAQAHLDRAVHVLQAGASDAPALRLERADVMRAAGAPGVAVDELVQSVKPVLGDDAALGIVAGELALREHKLEEAHGHFADAIRVAADGVGAARAHFRLAQLAATAGRAGEEQHECDALLRVSPQHERGHALCVAPAVDAGVATGAPTVPADLGVPAAKKEPTDEKGLVAQADHLAESGHSSQARKIYERVLEMNPKSVLAIVGLGYCDLDAERYMQAVDRFDAALALDPSSGDAMLGLAESYRVRGRTTQAIDSYKKYLAAHPTGDKAQLATKNLRELEAKPSADATAVPGRTTIKAQDKAATKEDDKADDTRDHMVLPRLPAEAQ